ncbi:MAG: response regulator transcription factor, partial [Planctomycetes bacterium]|nr:response regulator transcription factor [Planctomycetota bacterium]
MKQESTDEVINAVRTVLSKEIYVSDQMGSKMLNKLVDGQPASSSPVERLSDRELEVFQLIGQGQGTRQIAERLHLSIKTIESYRAHIKDKLNLRTAMELVHRAIHWAGNEAGNG